MGKLSIMPTQTAAAPQPEVPFAATGAGVAANTIKGLLGWVPLDENPWVKVAADIGHGIARTAGSLGLSIVNKTLSAIQPESVRPTIDIPEYLHPLFGADEKTISDIPTRANAAVEKLKSNPLVEKYGLGPALMPLAYGSIAATTALDLTGFGGEERNAIKALVKETDPALVHGILRKMGFEDNLAQKFAPELAAAKDEKQVLEIMDVAKGVHGMSALSDAEKANEAERGAVSDANYTPKSKPIEPSVIEEYKVNNDPFASLDMVKRDFPALPEEAAKRTAARLAEEQDVSKIGTILKGARGLNERLATGEIKTASQMPKLSITEARPPAEKPIMGASRQKIEELKQNRDILRETLVEHPGRELSKYVSPATGELPAFERGAKSKFGSRGDTILQNLLGHEASGGGDIEVANKKLAEYKSMKEQERQMTAEIKRLAPDAKNEKVLDESSNKTEAHLALMREKAKAKVLTPAESIHDLATGADGKGWQSLIKGFVAKAKPEASAHILDYLATPEFVLEKVGLAKAAEKLQDAKYSYKRVLKKEIATIEDWKRELKGIPYASTRIFRYLDGEARFVKSEMTPAEIKVAGEIKTYLEDWARRLKLPEDRQLSNYITHIFEDVPGKGIPRSVFDEDPELAALMEKTPAGSVYDPFLQAREGKKGYKQDVWAALDAYVKRGSRKEAMDPALEFLKEEATKVDKYTYGYITNLTHRINMRPTELDQGVDKFIHQVPGLRSVVKGVRPLMSLTRTIRNVFYRGTLGLNVSSALRNLSQGANTYAKLGEKHTIIGYTKLLSRLVTNNLGELKQAGVLEDELVQDKKIGVYKSVMQAVDPVLYAQFTLAERINRGAAYFGGKSKALAKGLSEEQAVKYAQRMVRETQFAFGAADSPVALASDVSKTLLQLQSYNLKQSEFLIRMVKNGEWAGITRYAAGATAFLYTIGQAFGMTWNQLIPSVGLGGSPVGNITAGLTELMSSNPQTHAKGVSDLKRAAVTIVPGGAQIKKTIGGIKAFNEGRDKTPSGKTRFRIPQDTTTRIQTAVFGKSSIPAARKYYDSLGKKKPKGKKAPLSI